jgi:transcriptional regulator with XRE-family HTH domain
MIGYRKSEINVSGDLEGDSRMSEFGDKLISLRTARGLTAKEVCKQVHIPQSRLNELEWGVRIPTPSQIESLENFFEVDSKALADLAKLSEKI